jgi:hypothetical protein
MGGQFQRTNWGRKKRGVKGVKVNGVARTPRTPPRNEEGSKVNSRRSEINSESDE